MTTGTHKKAKVYKGVDPYGNVVVKTEHQIRAWLRVKLYNYLWKIKGKTSYGSRKKLETISDDLKWIIKTLDGYIKKEAN